jgi:hypothetical protein
MNGVSLVEYRNKRAVDPAVERESMIIGGALKRGQFAPMRQRLAPYPVRVRSLILKICLPMAMK